MEVEGLFFSGMRLQMVKILPKLKLAKEKKNAEVSEWSVGDVQIAMPMALMSRFYPYRSYPKSYFLTRVN